MDSTEPLVSLLNKLSAQGYDFTTVSPATHARVVARKGEAAGLRDIFGWNLPFRPEQLPAGMLELLTAANAVEDAGDYLKSRVRVARLGEQLFLHSSYPTEEDDSVFFGPDTYRFAAFIAEELKSLGETGHVVDIGAGSGAGGILAGSLLPQARVTLSDVNPAALRLAAINAAHAGVEVELVQGSGLSRVEGPTDLVLANPPYMADAKSRAYRDGGGLLGAELSLQWALEAAERLEPGGTMLLYTGVAIIDGRDRLKEALESRLPRDCTLRYSEMDPDVFGEELEREAYREAERICAVNAVIRKSG
ncbi:MAG TPA: methyltransferase [Allosphingosinicella sp.]|nr:methyltransferase [Allosphingosinicella sp.]